MCKLDSVHDGFPFGVLGEVYFVFVVDTDDWLVGPDRKDTQLIDRLKFFTFGRCGTRHTSKFVVLFEKVLVGNGCDGFGFTLDSYSLFGFDRLVESLVESTTWHCTSGIGIDDDYFAIRYDIFFVCAIDCLGFDSVFDVVYLIEAEISVEIFYSQNTLKFGDTLGGKGSIFGLFVDVVVSMWFGF